MINLIGYLGLALNLVSMALNNVLGLRIFAMLANCIYLIYGFLLNAPPFIIGSALAIAIHLFHITKLKRKEIVKLKLNQGMFVQLKHYFFKNCQTKNTTL